MLYEKVKEATQRAKAKHPGADGFYISIDDSMAFVTFHSLAVTKLQNTSVCQFISMNQYLHATYLESYHNTVMTDKDEYKTSHNTRRNVINSYNTFNHKTKSNKIKQSERDKGLRVH